MASLRIALAQLNPKVGDLDGNVAKIVAAYDQAETAGCDIVAFPELAITGYPPEDLVLKSGFVADNLEALAKVAAHTGRCAAVVGYVAADRDIYNAAAMCANGEVLGTYRKRLLPNYAVFDEARYFTPGGASDPYELYVIGGVKVGISICEDVWSPTGPLAEQAAGGAEVNININGSPYHFDKASDRERMLATRAADASCSLVYVNQVCGHAVRSLRGMDLVFPRLRWPLRLRRGSRLPSRRRSLHRDAPQTLLPRPPHHADDRTRQLRLAVVAVPPASQTRHPSAC